MSKISALIITRNEAENIAFVIKNLSFTDEIIVIDSFSEDNTFTIAGSFPNVKVFQHHFEDFTKQRNLALTKANYSWILFLDADERISEPLQKEILSTVNSKQNADAYYFYRKFMFKGKPLNFCGLQSDKNIRLFKKDRAKYAEKRLVHEVLEVNGTISYLKNKLIHHSYRDFKSYKEKTMNYARLKAKELYTEGLKPNLFHYYLKPIYRFIYAYIIRGGILDGRKGFIICYLNAFGVYKRYEILRKLSEK